MIISPFFRRKKGDMNDPQDTSIALFVGLVVVILFFFLFSPAFTFLQVMSYFDLSEKVENLYQYKQTPCENQEFMLLKDFVLIKNGSHAISKSLYSITTNSLDEYNSKSRHYRVDLEGTFENSSALHKELKLYSRGSHFKVLSYYRVIYVGEQSSEEISYYLVESLSDNEKAWISTSDFDSYICAPVYSDEYLANSYFYNYDIFDTKIHNTNSSKFLQINYVEIEPFSDNEDIFPVSRTYHSNFDLKLDNEYEKKIHEQIELSMHLAKASEPKEQPVKKSFKEYNKTVDINITFNANPIKTLWR